MSAPKFSNKDLVINLKQEPSKLIGEIPLLNESEKISITITTAHTEIISSPSVIARAIGVTAILSEEKSFYSYFEKITEIITAIVVALTLVSIWSSIKQVRFTESVKDIEDKGSEIEEILLNTENKRIEWEKTNEQRMAELEKNKKEREKRELEHEQGKPDREQLIFTLLNKYGLSHVFVEILRYGSEITYRDAAFHTLHAMLIDETNSQKYLSFLEELSSLDAMNPASKGLIMYLCGKAYKHLGNQQNSVIWFDKCKNVTPLMYQHLIENDQYYDLSNVQRYLKS